MRVPGGVIWAADVHGIVGIRLPRRAQIIAERKAGPLCRTGKERDENGVVSGLQTRRVFGVNDRRSRPGGPRRVDVRFEHQPLTDPVQQIGASCVGPITVDDSGYVVVSPGERVGVALVREVIGAVPEPKPVHVVQVAAGRREVELTAVRLVVVRLWIRVVPDGRHRPPPAIAAGPGSAIARASTFVAPSGAARAAARIN